MEFVQKQKNNYNTVVDKICTTTTTYVETLVVETCHK